MTETRNKLKKEPLIFVVDDDPIYHHLVEYNLTVDNYDNILKFSSGEECLFNIDKMPDVVILDYEMDGLNGLQVLEKIKQFNKNIEVILFSGQEDNNIVKKSIEMGASSYIQKNEKAYNQIRFMVNQITENKMDHE